MVAGLPDKIEDMMSSDKRQALSAEGAMHLGQAVMHRQHVC